MHQYITVKYEHAIGHVRSEALPVGGVLPIVSRCRPFLEMKLGFEREEKGIKSQLLPWNHLICIGL